MMEIANGDWRVQSEALRALQESAEVYLIQLFEDSYLCTAHRKRMTLEVRDIHLVKYMRGARDPGS